MFTTLSLTAAVVRSYVSGRCDFTDPIPIDTRWAAPQHGLAFAVYRIHRFHAGGPFLHGCANGPDFVVRPSSLAELTSHGAAGLVLRLTASPDPVGLKHKQCRNTPGSLRCRNGLDPAE